MLAQMCRVTATLLLLHRPALLAVAVGSSTALGCTHTIAMHELISVGALLVARVDHSCSAIRQSLGGTVCLL
jgi:hypothetical protein